MEPREILEKLVKHGLFRVEDNRVYVNQELLKKVARYIEGPRRRRSFVLNILSFEGKKIEEATLKVTNSLLKKEKSHIRRAIEILEKRPWEAAPAVENADDVVVVLERPYRQQKNIGSYLKEIGEQLLRKPELVDDFLNAIHLDVESFKKWARDRFFVIYHTSTHLENTLKTLRRIVKHLESNEVTEYHLKSWLAAVESSGICPACGARLRSQVCQWCGYERVGGKFDPETGIPAEDLPTVRMFHPIVVRHAGKLYPNPLHPLIKALLAYYSKRARRASKAH